MYHGTLCICIKMHSAFWILLNYGNVFRSRFSGPRAGAPPTLASAPTRVPLVAVINLPAEGTGWWCGLRVRGGRRLDVGWGAGGSDGQQGGPERGVKRASHRDYYV